MNVVSSARRHGKLLLAVVLAMASIAVAGGAYSPAPRFEAEPPQITVTPSGDVLGLAPLQILISDQGVGTKSVTATLSQGGSTLNLVVEQLAQPAGAKTITVTPAKTSP